MNFNKKFNPIKKIGHLDKNIQSKNYDYIRFIILFTEYVKDLKITLNYHFMKI